MQRDVRQALVDSDGLSRRAHDAHQEVLAQRLDALRTALATLDVEIGGGTFVSAGIVREIGRITADLVELEVRLAPHVREPLRALVSTLRVVPKHAARWSGGRTHHARTFVTIAAAGIGVLAAAGLTWAIVRRG